MKSVNRERNVIAAMPRTGHHGALVGGSSGENAKPISTVAAIAKRVYRVTVGAGTS